MENDDDINSINILVNSIDEMSNNNLIKSKYIICPKCKEKARIKINDYKIKLYDCKNGHNIDNILLEEYENTQKIDISKIICNICNINNKSKAYNNEFYICNECKKNICPSCKSRHDKNHDIIKYEQKEYLCENHNEIYIKYCNKCKINICLSCYDEHNNHEIISYEKFNPNIDKIKSDIIKLKDTIDIFKSDIKIIINKLNKVIENIDIYYNINKDIINYYEKKNRNYEILQNINEINNNIIKEINKKNKENNIINKFKEIMNIYKKMGNNEIELIYNINEEDKERGKINILGKSFVNNYKNICKIIYENNEYELNKEFKINNNNILKIRLKNILDISNMNNIFNGCDSLSSLTDLSKWDTTNINNMSFIFYNCTELESLPDISKWNTENVINMTGLFGCEYKYESKLKSIPDISKWNICNVKYLGGSYNSISSLSPLTDFEIKKMNENNEEYIESGIFYNCDSLSSLPDISKWNTNNVTDMSYLFSFCKSLSSLPDISKWNTSNVTNMCSLFSHCESLSSLPDISKWNTNNVTDMCSLFSDCESLSSMPDIFKWNTNNVINMSFLFYNCNSLSSLPDISKWNISKLKYKSCMLSGCNIISQIPSKFK